MFQQFPVARAVGYDLTPLRGFAHCRLDSRDTRAKKMA